jgi:hypothetical protein
MPGKTLLWSIGWSVASRPRAIEFGVIAFKCWAGESFPKVIDHAIKTRTFRLIALLSRHSLAKPNPLKERTLALAISRRRNIDFMIPLNVDGLKPDELEWDYTDLTYIPFQDWAVAAPRKGR